MTDQLPQTIEMEDPWMTRREAAAYLRVTPETLKNLAVRGRGPRYAKDDSIANSPVRYRRSWLDEYMANWTVIEPSTAKHAAEEYERQKAS